MCVYLTWAYHRGEYASRGSLVLRLQLPGKGERCLLLVRLMSPQRLSTRWGRR